MRLEEYSRNFDQDVAKLKRDLAAAKINFAGWSEGRKDVADLLQEIYQGETELLPDARYGLVRQLRVLKVEVEFTDISGQIWKLKELQQVWHTKRNPDGTPRVDVRTHVGFGISEKINKQELSANGEVKREGVQRALEEELGISEPLPATFLGTRPDFDDSPSYPGLKTKYLEYIYVVSLPVRLYQPHFIERGHNKDTHFGWVRV